MCPFRLKRGPREPKQTRDDQRKRRPDREDGERDEENGRKEMRGVREEACNAERPGCDVGHRQRQPRCFDEVSGRDWPETQERTSIIPPAPDRTVPNRTAQTCSINYCPAVARLPTRQTHERSRIDQVLSHSRRIRHEAWALNVRAQLWELHLVLREREAEDALLRRLSDQRGECTGSSWEALRAGM